MRELSPSDSSSWYQTSRAAGWFVYTIHAAERRVSPPLYVGVTNQLYERLSAHRRDRAWWPLVGLITVVHFFSREDAYEAEERQIYASRPLFNVANNVHTPQLEAKA